MPRHHPDTSDFVAVDLRPYLNNRGRTPLDALQLGELNVWRNSLPADELPLPGDLFDVQGVPFRLDEIRDASDRRGADNVRCLRQMVHVPRGRYDWLYVLATAERRTEDLLYLHFQDGAVDAEWLRISDFWEGALAHFGEIAAFRLTRMHYPRHADSRMRPTLWRQRVAISRSAILTAIRLPDNPAIHLFAWTLERSCSHGRQP
jgi:hypothetical protein